MTSRYLKTILAALFVVAAASGQNPDTSGNGTVKGAYFVREVLMTGNADGSVTAAGSVVGIATFDGNGNYTFTGQGTSLASGNNSSLSLSGTYTRWFEWFFSDDEPGGFRRMLNSAVCLPWVRQHSWPAPPKA